MIILDDISKKILHSDKVILMYLAQNGCFSHALTPLPTTPATTKHIIQNTCTKKATVTCLALCESKYKHSYEDIKNDIQPRIRTDKKTSCSREP